jgi:hypothetical protein
LLIPRIIKAIFVEVRLVDILRGSTQDLAANSFDCLRGPFRWMVNVAVVGWIKDLETVDGDHSELPSSPTKAT